MLINFSCNGTCDPAFLDIKKENKQQIKRRKPRAQRGYFFEVCSVLCSSRPMSACSGLAADTEGRRLSRGRRGVRFARRRGGPLGGWKHSVILTEVRITQRHTFVKI